MNVTEAGYSDIERLRDGIDTAWQVAHQFGLDPFPTHFELVPASIMYEFASYGLPGRFSHWTHGKAYHRQKMQYDFGLSKIYEMVVNTNPSYAFLMEMNNLLQNTFVAAHVFGHTDFFKNNAYFQHTSRRMIDKVSVHAERIAKYEFDHGKDKVEHFLDAALSIQEHIDYNLFMHDQEEIKQEETAKQRHTTEFDDLLSVDEKADKAQEARDRVPGTPPRFPEKPEKDILLFLIRHAPHLEPWQRDILEIVRAEMLYFVPQMQTKVMNEGWACLVSSSLLLTENGFMRYDDLHDALAQGKTLRVNSGDGACDQVTNRHIRRNAATIRLRTRRGLVLEGAEGHKLSVGPEQWMELRDVRVGQRIPLSIGENIWPEHLASIAQPEQMTQQTVGTGVAAHSTANTGHRSADQHSRAQYGERFPLVAPKYISTQFAEFLGYLLGEGHIHSAQHAISYSTAKRTQADRYAQLVLELFAIEPSVFWDDKTADSQIGRWRVAFYAANVLDLLRSLGIDLTAKASEKRIPTAILRSPKAVMSAFLRAYFDCAGRVSSSNGIMLSVESADLAQTLQIVLQNYGILSQRDDCALSIEDESARLFAREIGFGLAHKQKRLDAYLGALRGSLQEQPWDEVVSVEHGVADVYDITVDRSHRYVANGMLHHNSIWHSRIMREMADKSFISDSEVVEFAQLHSGVLSPSRTSLNPYYIGFKIFEDIERRWENPTREEQDLLGRKPGRGREKIFEVRELDNDVSFLRNYLTEDLIKDLDLYLYRKEGDEWVIVEKNWQKVRDSIVASMTNFGNPYLVIENGDYHGNRELYIRHLFEGQELDLVYAEKTLQHVYVMWGRPVHLETVFEGKRILLSYDGERNSKSTLEK